MTIVPRAVGAAITTGSTAAVQGIQMLNPQRWGAASTGRTSSWNANGRNGYVRDFEKGGDGMLFDIGADDDDDADETNEKASDKQTPRCKSMIICYSTSSLTLPCSLIDRVNDEHRRLE